MKYGLVCGRENLLTIIAAMCFIWLITYFLLKLTERNDKEFSMDVTKRSLVMELVGSFLFAYEGVIKGYLIQGGGAYLMLSIYLLYSASTDRKICKVYHFIQYPAVIVLGGLLLKNAYVKNGQGEWQGYGIKSWEMIGIELIIFVLLQGWIFIEMYGKGDALAFLICALFLFAKGYGLEKVLWHMALVFLLLAAVQAVRGNIAGNGNLKEKVALLPYIAVGFLMC